MKISNNKTKDDVTFVMKLPPKSSYTIVSDNNPKIEKTIKSTTSSNNLNKLYIIIIILLMIIAYLYFNRK